MADLSRLSDVSIALDTASVKIKSFSDMIIVGETDAFTDRVITVSAISELVSRGIGESDPLYIAVSNALMQKNSGSGVSKVYVGRKQKTTTATTPSKDADGKDTSTTSTTGETWVEAVQACRKASRDFFGVVTTTTNVDDMLAIAAYCESEGLMFACSNGDTNVKNATITSCTLSRLAAKNYANTFFVYDEKCTTQNAPAAIMGRLFGKEPGTENWTNQKIAGIEATALDETEYNAIRAKNGMTFESFGDFSLTQNGKVVGNEWIDIIRGRAAMLEELRVNSVLALVDKRVKYNDSGIATIISSVVEILSKYQRIGFIDDEVLVDGTVSPGFVVYAPSAAEITRNQRANRTYATITFNARVAGSINQMTIRGTLSYDTSL